MSYILDALAKADADRKGGDTAAQAAPHSGAMNTRARSTKWVTVALVAALAVAGLAVWWARSPAPVVVAPIAPEPTPTTAPPIDAPAPQADSALPAQTNAEPLPILAPKPVVQAPPAKAPATSSPPAQPTNAKATDAPGPATLPRPPLGTPALSISGATYSDNPAHRLLIVNGKVVQEGQEAAPGITLEAIGPRSAVFNEGGTRFNINHQ
jgi:general secretion pathway protein B